MEKNKGKPVDDYCCGAFSSDAGCCPHEVQREMFPGFINEQKPPKRWIEFTPIGDSRPFDKRKPYQKITVPDWVKEGRNRDTRYNLDDDIEED